MKNLATLNHRQNFRETKLSQATIGNLSGTSKCRENQLTALNPQGVGTYNVFYKEQD
jgi:hypothetical protein